MRRPTTAVRPTPARTGVQQEGWSSPPTVRRTITSFLLTQMNNGAFRSRDPAKAFFVDVSDKLNTPTVIFAGKLIAQVGLATNKPAEFVVLKIAQDTRALEAELAGSN